MDTNLAAKKVELIEWLARLQDEELINRIEMIRKGSAKDAYEQRMPNSEEQLRAKIDRAEKNVLEGKVYVQEDVENYFKIRFKSK